ncbi:hypothetical protein RI367_007035 [Sorochytrium milnesiophthora]
MHNILSLLFASAFWVLIAPSHAEWSYACEYRAPNLPFTTPTVRQVFLDFRLKAPLKNYETAMAWLRSELRKDQSILPTLNSPVEAVVNMAQAAPVAVPSDRSTALEWLLWATTQFDVYEPQMVHMQWLLRQAYTLAGARNSTNTHAQPTHDARVTDLLDQAISAHTSEDKSEVLHLKSVLRTCFDGVFLAGDTRTKLQHNYEAHRGKWNQILVKAPNGYMTQSAFTCIKLTKVVVAQYLAAATAYSNYLIETTCYRNGRHVGCPNTQRDLKALYMSMEQDWTALKNYWKKTVLPALCDAERLTPVGNIDIVAMVNQRKSAGLHNFTFKSSDHRTGIIAKTKQSPADHLFLSKLEFWHQLHSSYTCKVIYAEVTS